jgi:hypothetical protein
MQNDQQGQKSVECGPEQFVHLAAVFLPSLLGDPKSEKWRVGIKLGLGKLFKMELSVMTSGPALFSAFLC